MKKNLIMIIMAGFFLMPPSLAHAQFDEFPITNITSGIRDPNADYTCTDHTGKVIDPSNCLNLSFPPITCAYDDSSDETDESKKKTVSQETPQK